MIPKIKAVAYGKYYFPERFTYDSGCVSFESEDGYLTTEIFSFFTGVYDNTTWEELTEKQRSDWTLAGNMPSEWKGKEIYEGDKMDYPQDGDDPGAPFIVIFEDGSYRKRYPKWDKALPRPEINKSEVSCMNLKIIGYRLSFRVEFYQGQENEN